MEKNFQLNPQEMRIQGLLGRYLASRNSSTDAGTPHISDDLLSAFVEGSLSNRESDPIVSHLVDCGFCRNTTAELIRMDFAFAEETLPETIGKTEPTSISEVLSGLFSKIFGTTDGAVFAHEETAKKEENAKKNDNQD